MLPIFSSHLLIALFRQLWNKRSQLSRRYLWVKLPFDGAPRLNFDWSMSSSLEDLQPVITCLNKSKRSWRGKASHYFAQTTECKLYTVFYCFACGHLPSHRSNKAVSDGAISFFLDHHVRTRVARVSYGTNTTVLYKKSDPEHIKRSASKVIDVDGSPKIKGIFDVLLPKVDPS